MTSSIHGGGWAGALRALLAGAALACAGVPAAAQPVLPAAPATEGLEAPGVAPAALPPPLMGRLRDHRAGRATPVPDMLPHAAAVLPYAALAHDAYCNDVMSHGDEEGCRRETGYHRFGWHLLGAFPTDDMLGGRSRRGLHAVVYFADDGEQRPVRVGIAFKGTDFGSWSDWHSNLRWVLPGRDQYDVLAEIAHEIVARSQREIALLLGRPVHGWHIVTTGHSLGGGLAQLLAYKHADVRAAVVFDSSPVTGYYGCVADHEVNCNVPAWRVYERGEVLAWLRAATRWVLPLSENITELELDLMGGNPIANHSMSRFYRRLAEETAARALPSVMHADLFAPRFDCNCSSTRRPALWVAAAAACEALARERAPDAEPPAPVQTAAWLP